MITHTITQESAELLFEALRLARDGQRGYHAAVGRIENDPSLRETLVRFGTQRGQTANELEQAMAVGQIEATSDGTLAGTVHRAWIGVRQAVSAASNHAVLEECIRGEEAANTKFARARRQLLPEPLASLTSRLEQEATDAIETLRKLTQATN